MGLLCKSDFFNTLEKVYAHVIEKQRGKTHCFDLFSVDSSVQFSVQKLKFINLGSNFFFFITVLIMLVN